LVSVFHNYFLSVLNFCFGNYNKYGLAFKKSIGASFNLQQKYRYKYSAVLSGVKQLYTLPVKPMPFSFCNKLIIYDLTIDSEKIRLNYIDKTDEAKPDCAFVAGAELLLYENVFTKIVFILISLPFQFTLLVAGLFIKDKSGLNCMPINIVTAYNLCKLCKRTASKNLLMFCVFDTNSVFLTLCLQKIGVHVTSFTSEVPLYKWNQIILADHLKICIDYQKTEIDIFSKSILYKTLSYIEPETYYRAKHLYLKEQVYSNNLGFVSTGGWVRNRLDHIHQGLDFETFENQILVDLNEILKQQKHICLIIYPHPRELEYCSLSELRSYYQKKLPDIQFEINNSDTFSNLLFNETYLSICFISTLIFERLYAKRKSALIYYKEEHFPLPYKSDFLSFIFNKTEFEKLIVDTYQNKLN
jgi:hypothetical protein